MNQNSSDLSDESEQQKFKVWIKTAEILVMNRNSTDLSDESKKWFKWWIETVVILSDVIRLYAASSSYIGVGTLHGI